MLQRYLSGKRTNSGAMQQYWYWGHNYDYVYLLDLLPRAGKYRRILAEHEDEGSRSSDEKVERAHEYVEPAVDFFDSLSPIADKLWNLAVDPFRKEDDMDDFFDNSQENSDDHDLGDHRALNMKQNRENAEKLAAEIADQVNEYSEDDVLDTEEEMKDGLEDTDEQESGSEGNEETEEELEDDEWMKNIKRRRGSIGRRKSVSPRRRNRRSELSEPPSTGSQKRRIIREGDDGSSS